MTDLPMRPRKRPTRSLSPTTRKRLYRTGLATIALLVAYGVLSEDLAAAWAALLAPLLIIAGDNIQEDQ